MISKIAFLTLLNFFFASGFQSKNIKSSNSNRSILFYPNIINKQLPSDLYSNFISNIQNKDINVLVSQDRLKNQKYINKNNDSPSKCIVAHSFAAKEAINFFNENDNIDKLVLLDPLDIDKINLPKFELPKMPSLFNNIEERIFDNAISIDKLASKINKIYSNDILNDDVCDNTIEIIEMPKKEKKVLVVRTKESSKWSLFPSIPPISVLELDLTSLNYKDINIFNINGFGHFDVMDETWSNLAIKFSKGSLKRDYEILNEYHEKLATTLNTFLSHE